ncbi:MAG TPA: CRISPR-associated protein Cas4 [Ktedonobacteraceae bacterium]|jgi:CRISPR-associated exonuclease Cas4
MYETFQQEALPISSLGALEYCPRKFYYQIVQGEMPGADLMVAEPLACQGIPQAGAHLTESAATATTRLYLYSESLHLTGFADVLEESAGVLVPVEYRPGSPGDWPGDRIQLCARALCLEEMRPGKPLLYGYISYIDAHRRVRVPFDPPLRARTRETIARALQVAARHTPPSPLSGPLMARCPGCSLFALCLPGEVQALHMHKGGENH